MLKHRIPAAFRSGAGRTGMKEWDVDGCVGLPYGSVLVAEKGKTCEEMQFAPRKEISSGPEKAAPLEIFPDRETLISPVDRECASCVYRLQHSLNSRSFMRWFPEMSYRNHA